MFICEQKDYAVLQSIEEPAYKKKIIILQCWLTTMMNSSDLVYFLNE